MTTQRDDGGGSPLHLAEVELECIHQMRGVELEMPGSHGTLAPRKISRRRSKVIVDPQYVATDSFFGRLTQKPIFEDAVLLLICLNAVWIGMDVDQNGRPGTFVTPSLLEGGQSIFCLGFVIEILCRFLSYKRKMDFFQGSMRNWNMFDTILVALMLAETVIQATQARGMKLMKFPSVLRLMKLLRISRLCYLIPELGMMVHSMFVAVRGTAAMFLLLIGLVYVFAIIFTHWVRVLGVSRNCVPDKFVRDLEFCFDEHFGDMALTFLTLSQILILDEVFVIVRQIFDESPWYGGVILIYMILGCFTLLNMLVAIIVEIVHEFQTLERREQLRLALDSFILLMDDDNSGTISRNEFERHAGCILEELGLPEQTMRDAFEMLDAHNHGLVEVAELQQFVFKSLQPMQTQDVLSIAVKVQALGTALGAGRHHMAITKKERMKHGPPPDIFDPLGPSSIVEFPRFNAAELEARLESLWRLCLTAGLMPLPLPIPPDEAALATVGDARIARLRELAIMDLAPALRTLRGQLLGLRACRRALELRGRPPGKASLEELMAKVVYAVEALVPPIDWPGIQAHDLPQIPHETDTVSC